MFIRNFLKALSGFPALIRISSLDKDFFNMEIGVVSILHCKSDFKLIK